MVSTTLWGAAVLSARLLGAAAHPMHTSVTEIVQEADGHSVRIGMRLFADDLTAAIGAPLDGAESDSLISVYLQDRFLITYGAGPPVALQWELAERLGDVVQIRLRAAVGRGLAGVRLANSVLCERFEDQVNIVRAIYSDRAVTLIFTRGDRAKPLQ
jgi:hypothetical protein